MEIKGVAADSLPLFFLVAMSPLLVISVMGMVDSMSVQAGYAIDDLRMTSRVDSVKGSYIYDYSTLGAEYSVNQKARKLGMTGGGFDWNSEGLDSGRVSYRNLREKIEQESTSYLREKYLDSIRPANCEVSQPAFSLELKEDEKGFVKGEMVSTDDISVKCSFEKGQVVSNISEGDEFGFEADNNRYLGIAREAFHVTDNLRMDWSDMKKRYRAEVTECRDPFGLSRRAKELAVSRARNSVKETAKESFSESDISDGTSITKQEYHLETYSRVSSSGPEPVGDCGCSASGDDCDTLFGATYELKIDRNNASLRFKDSENKILTENGYKVLKFVISDYYQEFD